MMFKMHGVPLGDRTLQLESHRLNDGTQIFKVVEREVEDIISIQTFQTFDEAQARYVNRAAGFERMRLEAMAVGPKEWSPRTGRCRCKIKGA